VKVGGRKLYEAARAGEAVEAEPRPIIVTAFDVTGRTGDDVDIRVVCSGGTYVRVLAADVGAALGCGAHLVALRRTAIGHLLVGEATAPDDPVLLPASRAVAHLPTIGVDADEAVAVSHGRVLGPAGIGGPHAVVDRDGRLLAIYEDDGPRSRPLVVLVPA
jgi:tRNA pseudouridine55 synthase